MPPAISLPLVAVPGRASWWRKLAAFSGPGYLVAVGYMDPGNWATDLAGGSHFGYALVGVVVAACVVAMLLQHLAIKLGVATGRNLAQICRDELPRPVTIALWLGAEIMIIACDLAEVIGTAIGLGLLFHLPLVVGLVVTGGDVLLLLALQHHGVRKLETLVILLIATVVACFGLELWLARPDMTALAQGLIPTTSLITNHELLYLAIGIIGATVMPHNLYLHSDVVRSRRVGPSVADKREAIRFATIDSTGALMIAGLVNVAILVVAAAGFYTHGWCNVSDLTQASGLLAPLLGAGMAGTLFAIALLASGQNSTVTATMAGQIIMEGFVNLRVKPWLRRLITRGLAIVPAVVVVLLLGAHALSGLLILSQVILSVQLPLALIPLVMFTSRKRIMGAHRNGLVMVVATSFIAVILTGLNVWLVWSCIHS